MNGKELSVAAYNDNDIKALIGCAKDISEPPKKDMRLVGADWRNEMKLVASNDAAGEFTVFMRQSEDFPENFSIGLVFHPNDGRGEITLLRCNGQHGVYNGGSGDANHPHWDYHIHTASEIAQDVGERAEKIAEKTVEYASFDEALQYFVKVVNLNQKDYDKYFFKSKQPRLFV